MFSCLSQLCFLFILSILYQVDHLLKINGQFLILCLFKLDLRDERLVVPLYLEQLIFKLEIFCVDCILATFFQSFVLILERSDLGLELLNHCLCQGGSVLGGLVSVGVLELVQLICLLI